MSLRSALWPATALLAVHGEIVATILLILTAWGPEARSADRTADIVLSNDRMEIVLSRDNGSILKLAPKGRQGSIFRSGEFGLWQARLDDKTVIDATSFSATSAKRRFRWESDVQARKLRLTYRSREIDVTIVATCRDGNVDLAAEVTPKEKLLLDFAIPARLRFDPDQVDRVVCPTDGNGSSGMDLHGSFFEPHEQWKPVSVGGKGYERLLGGQPVMRPDRDSAVPIHVTGEGRKWLGANFAANFHPFAAAMTRPPQAGQFDRALVDSQYGPQFSFKQLGAGRLWRLSGMISDNDGHATTNMVATVLDRLAGDRPTTRGKIGLVLLHHGPTYGGFTDVSPFAWDGRLRALRSVASGKVQFVALETVDQLTAAQAAGDFLAIINPYGEWFLVAKAGDMAAAVARVGRYVRGGGHWFETGGYPFFAELLPSQANSQYECTYPPAFADFFHFRTKAGAAAVFRVQPRDWAPWEGAKNHRAIFVPGNIACGGDDRGGWCDRPFVTYVAPKTSWQCPVVRVTVGASPRESLLAYRKANGITRRLEDKMPPDVLEKFKRSVLVYYDGNCAELLRHLNLLPVPSQIHLAQYLQGGFDKQYPDHLPPRADFGTPEEFRRFFDRAHAVGHLVVPYTNPTWWCDGPKGPTFERFGEGPLLKTLDGKVSFERYVQNYGFTVCHWHPAVQESNRRTVEQFRDRYPVDILFQDQCGARKWRYDTNPASPTPSAYVEGLLSMIDEDCRRVPLSTESGWDGVVNAESQLCGMTFELMPSSGRPLLKHRYDAATWEIFPLAQYLAHDEVVMIHHDLGQSVTDRQTVSWTLGLGYAMNYRTHVLSLTDPATRQWLLWLDRLQKSVCVRYVARPLDDFSHHWESDSSTYENGLIRARYGDLRVVANLDSRPRQEERQLAGYGFLVSAPGLIAANLRTLAGQDFGNEGVSFVTEGNVQHTDIWIYARPAEEVAVLLPSPAAGPIELAFDGGHEMQSTARGGVLPLRLPARSSPSEPSASHVRRLWHAVATGK
jgi:hypothetical protein